jgi:signal transduction histidine kinase/ActR/RegA family two-component response regulator
VRLRLKATLGIVGLLVATILVLALGSAHLMRRELREEVDRHGREMAAHLAQVAEYPLFIGDTASLDEITRQSSGETDVAYVRFEDTEGRVVSSWKAGDPEPPAAPAPTSGGGPPGAVEDEVKEFVAPVKLAPSSDILGLGAAPRLEAGRFMGRVRVGVSYSRAAAVAARANRALAGTVLPVAVVGVLLTLLLAHRVALPLQELSRRLEEVCRGQFGNEVQVRGSDEVAELAMSFNNMLRDLKSYRDEVDRVHNNLETLVSRRTHELEEANRELAAASRTKSEFLATVSHELRTPLNAILGFLSLVIDNHCADRLEEKELLGDAHTGARHLLSVINSILDLAKIETGKMGVQVCEVRVQDALEEARSLLRAQADLKGLALAVESVDSAMPSALADPGKLKQVLVNLVGNAIKFTEEGRVKMRAEVAEEKGHVRFEVQDTGIGVPPEKRHLLFRKFQQLDGSHTRRHGGTGLGLAISRALVEMMGGKIWLVSPGEGKGSTVFFTLPIYRDAEQAERATEAAGYSSSEVRRGDPDRADEEPPLPEGDGPLALVVEDDPACRLILREIFALCGYRVIEATTADEALERARQARPRLVSVDLGLPAGKGAALVDGCDLMRALERDPDTRGARLVLISGQDPQVVRERLQREELEAARVFSKPVDTREVLAWVESEAGDKRRPDA